MTIFDDYMARCRALVANLQGVLPSNELQLANHFIDHGEAPEGMRALAWAIVEGKIVVEPEIVDKIREYAADFIDESDMPQDLDSFIRRV